MKVQLRTGDILHCRGSRLLSRLIMKFTKSRFSHTAIVVECWGQLYIVDAQRNGVNPRPIEEWIKEFGYSYTISRPLIIGFDKKEFSLKAFSKVGSTKYDLASLLWYHPRYILTGKWKGKPEQKAQGRMYCSEYVAWVFNMPNWWKLSPEAVFEYCELNTDEFKTLLNSN